MLQPEAGYAAEGVPHPVVSITDPGFCRLAGKLARWGAGLSKGFHWAENLTHVPEPDTDVSGKMGGECRSEPRIAHDLLNSYSGGQHSPISEDAEGAHRKHQTA